MSKSAILKSSIAKKWWMSLTGLFLCLFLVGHLLGNLQLVFITGEDGQLAFNEYAYFMTHNLFIKVLSYVTYFSILFHAIDGIALTIQNKKARPINYAYNKPGENSSTASRNMAVLGSAILIFIILHMASFWAKMHFDKTMPLHKIERVEEQSAFNQDGSTSSQKDTVQYYITHTTGSYVPLSAFEAQGTDEAPLNIKNQTEFYLTKTNLKYAEGYKDLHSITMAYFGQDKMKEAGLAANPYAMLAVLGYVLAMGVLAFHLWHGFQSAFQTLGINHKRHTPIIQGFGKAFAIIVPLLFALIPIMIFLNK